MAILAQGLFCLKPRCGPRTVVIEWTSCSSEQQPRAASEPWMPNRRVFGIQDVRPPSTGRPLRVRRRGRTWTSTDRVPSESSQTPQTPQHHVMDRACTEEALKEVCKCLRLLRTLKLLPEDEPSDDDLASEDEDFAMRGPPSLGWRRMLRTEWRCMALKAPRKPKRVDTEETKPMWWKDMERTVAMRKSGELDAQPGRATRCGALRRWSPRCRRERPGVGGSAQCGLAVQVAKRAKFLSLAGHNSQGVKGPFCIVQIGCQRCAHTEVYVRMPFLGNRQHTLQHLG